jgi:hypothetical protein
MIRTISKNILKSSVHKSAYKISNLLDKENFIRAKEDAEINPPLSQVNKHYYNPEYRYLTEGTDIMRLYS